ncbi:hydroxyacid dehydrogenase [Malaciobacter molluscorum LMG 25693]|uniref:Hydroxyacid dehydrogenase n=1 Tax=Malaciobacter molluscorum LMG 25693 TaxID=870501 RepID=A0A2G1DG34_9BACT|nr:D-2-hydroxyacid dehydrogenase [Malaciobacter molluscorum]AXX91095.1 2-hydroxyacid dehydrogenase [Malaciobacter molluscorum LMG 25693]PHO17459.1 hydroxyacid dehydrogenase [Malaciobacter molluscorum LMG 25693]RXJ93700.1 hydroxyacid dehydrogenase [Malaciobacter molluscorum]
MKLVFLDRSTLGFDINLEQFNQFGEVVLYDSTKPTETLTRVKDADIVITNKVIIDKDIMDNSDIKLVCIAATGMNNVDLEYAKEKGIVVKNVAGYSTNSVTQLTFAYVFHFIQKLSYYTSYVNNGHWQKSEIFTHIDKPFFELKDKNWGIIGLGNIGENVARIAQSFGCNVSYYSTSGNNTNTSYEQKNLETLLKESDIISIHCPLNETTTNLLNKTNLPLIKDGAILMNLGRGGIINELDLATIIDTKELYCGIDVVSKEPIEQTSPLLKVQNKDRLALTPHIGWASVESRNELIKLIVMNIHEFVN